MISTQYNPGKLYHECCQSLSDRHNESQPDSDSACITCFPGGSDEEGIFYLLQIMLKSQNLQVSGSSHCRKGVAGSYICASI